MVSDVPKNDSTPANGTHDQQPLTWVRALGLLLAGGVQTLTLAPFDLHWLGPVSILLILLILLPVDGRRFFRAGWCLGLGLFGSGASWIYVSISEFGNTSAPIAVLLTVLFVAGLSLLPAATFWAWARLAGPTLLRRLILFPALWVLADWVRGWLLTGFPWLYLGTAQVDGPLAGLAPIAGVHGVTFIIAVTGAVLCSLWMTLRAGRKLSATALVLSLTVIWGGSAFLGKLDWTQRGQTPLTIAAVQGNIPQQMKWDPDFLQHQIEVYLKLTSEDWQRDLILWPETAIPVPQNQAGGLISFINERLGDSSTLVTGIPWYGFVSDVQNNAFRNAIMATGNGQGTYYKQKLVPFGEYVPLQNWLRGIIGFFDLPMSDFVPGPPNQPPLQVGDTNVMPYICYEVAYADFVAHNARDTGLLITISNDGWFGHSIGPLQHLQMARMRALETGRFMIRATNNGITAIIDDHGRIQTRIPQFERGVMRGKVHTVTGTTPFMTTGSWPVLILALILIVFARPRVIPRLSRQHAH